MVYAYLYAFYDMLGRVSLWLVDACMYDGCNPNKLKELVSASSIRLWWPYQSINKCMIDANPNELQELVSYLSIRLWWPYQTNNHTHTIPEAMPCYDMIASKHIGSRIVLLFLNEITHIPWRCSVFWGLLLLCFFLCLPKLAVFWALYWAGFPQVRLHWCCHVISLLLCIRKEKSDPLNVNCLLMLLLLPDYDLKETEWTGSIHP
jgi:hypothetical protein